MGTKPVCRAHSSRRTLRKLSNGANLAPFGQDFSFLGADQQLKNRCLAAFQCPFHLSIR